MSEDKVYDVPAEWKGRAFIDDAKYQEMYAASIADPDKFWGEQAKRISWMKPFTKVKNTSYAPGKLSIKWFEDGTLNAAYNCIDRHLPKRAKQTAIIWEGDDPKNSKHITYQELHDEVCRFANIMRGRNVKKGDRVTIYMPMIPEAAYAILACARIGAIHSVIFGGFSPDSIAGRIEDCKSNFVITADEGLRGGLDHKGHDVMGYDIDPSRMQKEQLPASGDRAERRALDRAAAAGEPDPVRLARRGRRARRDRLRRRPDAARAGVRGHDAAPRRAGRLRLRVAEGRRRVALRRDRRGRARTGS